MQYLMFSTYLGGQDLWDVLRVIYKKNAQIAENKSFCKYVIIMK